MSDRVLVVDDDAEMTKLLVKGLSMHGFEAVACGSARAALDAIADGDYDVVITDYKMKEMNGLELCERIAANRADVPVIVITAFGSLDSAVAAIRAGAYDFIVKPVAMDTLAIAVGRAARHHRLQEEVKRLRRVAAGNGRFAELMGASQAMAELYDLLARVADSDVSVLITGETGAGKELVARSLHQRSARRARPFVALNCAAMPEALLESELFGHARGAFTDAKSAHKGLLMQADGGTVFLDEIGDMPLSLQPKLLRALQERSVRPIGEVQEVSFDVRVIAATNQDLELLVEEKAFRGDLLFRLNVIQVRVPPLRARGGDVLLLAQHFLDNAATRAGKPVTGITPAAAERLLGYTWPGNVRELQNCIEHAVALTRTEELVVDDLPEKVRSYRSWRVLPSDAPEDLLTLEEMELRYIAHVMRIVAGNKRRAARILGCNRTTLYRKLERYKIDVTSDGDPERGR